MTNILDVDEHKKRCTNYDCEDPSCTDSDCEAGLDNRELQDKHDGTRVFRKNEDGTLSFYVVEFDGDPYLCELKTDEQITKIDNSKWEIKYVNVSDQQTGVQKWVRPWNIKPTTYTYDYSSEYSVIVDFNPIMKKPNESSFFGGLRSEGLDFQCVISDLIEKNM